MATAKRLEPAEVKAIAYKLWTNVEMIDLYLKNIRELQGMTGLLFKGGNGESRGHL